MVLDGAQRIDNRPVAVHRQTEVDAVAEGATAGDSVHHLAVALDPVTEGDTDPVGSRLTGVRRPVLEAERLVRGDRHFGVEIDLERPVRGRDVGNSRPQIRLDDAVPVPVDTEVADPVGVEAAECGRNAAVVLDGDRLEVDRPVDVDADGVGRGRAGGAVGRIHEILARRVGRLEDAADAAGVDGDDGVVTDGDPSRLESFRLRERARVGRVEPVPRNRRRRRRADGPGLHDQRRGGAVAAGDGDEVVPPRR
ncbi:hypothetical protein ACFQL0_17500 [Haloplanus litoreus]|uniref:hypothetical protein n=1 Tax=Haloplanus litoreus TaxID=767515 RepID=UPI00360EB745